MDVGVDTILPKKKEQDVALFQKQLAYCTKLLESAVFRKERCEQLMRRKSASKWDAKKKAQMVSKLMTVTNEIEQIKAAINDLNYKLENQA